MLEAGSEDDERPMKQQKLFKKQGPGRPRKLKQFADYDEEYFDL